MKYHTLFLFRKLGTMSQNLSSAAFLIGALKVYSIPAIHSKILSRNMRFQQCGMCNQQRLRPACAYAQSDQSLCQSLEYALTLRLLTEQHLEFLCLKGGFTGSSESTLVKMPLCWKSHVMAQMICCRPLDLSTLMKLFFLFLN